MNPRRTHSVRTGAVLFLGLGTLLVPLHAAAGPPPPGNPLALYETRVARWMNLRRTLAEETHAARELRRQAGAELELLSREAGSLRHALDAAAADAVARAAQRDRLRRQHAALDAVRQRVEAALERAEADLRSWEARLPEGLRQPTEEAFPAPSEAAGAAMRRPLAERARAVTEGYARLETLHQGLHAGRELLDTGEGRRRLVEVLYLGLARGFAVSPQDDWAAVGTPVPKGWAWEPRPADVARIRAALAVAQRARPARLVVLPLQITPVEEIP